MYAVIETGGKQYRVAENDRVTVEKLEGKPGEVVTFEKVLLVADGDKISLGSAVKGAKVSGTVLLQDRGERIRVAKFIRRGGYYNRMGHRQYLTTVTINKISL